MLQSGELFFGMPDSLAVLTWIPLAHLTLTSILALGLLFAWKNRWWDWPRRILYTCIVIAFTLQVTFFVTWNYIPIEW